MPVDATSHVADTDLVQVGDGGDARLVRRAWAPLRGIIRISRSEPWWYGVTGLATLGVAHQVIAKSGLVSDRYLPPATTIIRRAVDLLGDREFLTDLGHTLLSAALGLALAVPLAIVLGVVLGLQPTIYKATRVLIDLLRPIPAVAVVPLLQLTVGIGQESVALTVALAAVWPPMLNTIHGVSDVDGVALQTARVLGAGPVRRLLTVTVPSAAPAIGAGVRVAVSLTLVITVATELIMGTDLGVGSYILNLSQGGFHADAVYAAVAITGLVGLGINLVAVGVERRCFPWHQRGGAA